MKWDLFAYGDDTQSETNHNCQKIICSHWHHPPLSLERGGRKQTATVLANGTAYTISHFPNKKHRLLGAFFVGTFFLVLVGQASPGVRAPSSVKRAWQEWGSSQTRPDYRLPTTDYFGASGNRAMLAWRQVGTDHRLLNAPNDSLPQ